MMTQPTSLSFSNDQATAKRYLSLWLPYWSTDRWYLRQKPSQTKTRLPQNHPLVAINTLAGRRLISTANEEAMRQGFTPGLSLADALARLPELAHFPADPIGDNRSLHRLAAWAQRFSPLVMCNPPDGLLIDITGCAHLWQGEEGLRQDLLRRLQQRGYHCRAGIADTIGAAWAAAHFSEASPIMPVANHREVLATLPVDALRIDPSIAETLRRLGLRSIGDLYPLPRASIVSRFQRPLLDRLDQALGTLPEPFEATFAPPPHRVSRLFAEPISTAEAIQHCLILLAGRLMQQLGELGLGARRIKLSCYRLDHQVSEIGIGLSLPSAQAAHIVDLLSRKIDQIAPEPGIELIMLSAGKVEALRQSQVSLAQRHQLRGSGDTIALAGLIDRLTNRLGNGSVYRLAPVDSYIPERAITQQMPMRPQSKSWPQIITASDMIYWRPLRLLKYPEPIEAIAPIPDDPPLQFYWRRIRHHIRAASGPERISWEWWRGLNEKHICREPIARDYYRVENENGQRFWLYRDGLYRPDRPSPRWFLHGLFA